MNVRELGAQRHDHFTAADKLIRAARESGKDLAGAELEQYNKHIQDIKNIDHLIALSERTDPIPTSGQPGFIDWTRVGNPGAAQPTNGNSPLIRRDAVELWADSRTGRPIPVLKPGQRMSALVPQAPGSDDPLSLERYLRGLITGRWEGAQRERELQASMGEGGSGTYLVPTPMSLQIIDKVRYASVMLRAGARTVPMSEASLSMARVATDMTPAWHTELAAITASDMTFERVSFAAQTLAAIGIVSVELIEDAIVDTVVSDAIAKVLALELDRACLRGSGTAPEIRGVRNQSNVGVDASTTFGANGSTISGSAPTGAVAWDWASKAISTLWGLNESPTAMIYSARTAGLLDLLRASTGEVLVPPPSVAGLQRFFSNQIPNTLTQGTNNDASECYFGDFSQALIGMRTEVKLEISRTASVGATSMFTNMGVGIRAFLRADLQLARPAAFRVVCGIRG